MSTPIKPFSCGTCNEAYTDSGAHQPLVFECGHGSCKGCVLQAQALSSAKTVICQECKYQVLSVQTPNYALIEQMQNFSSKVVELTAKYQEEEQLKEEEIEDQIADAKDQYSKMKVCIIEKATDELVQNPSDAHLQQKAEELVELGIYDDVKKAKWELSSIVNLLSQDFVQAIVQQQINSAAHEFVEQRKGVIIQEEEIENKAIELGYPVDNFFKEVIEAASETNTVTLVLSSSCAKKLNQGQSLGALRQALQLT